MAVKDWLASVGELVVNKITAVIGSFKKVQVENGVEVVDKATGAIWCITVYNAQLVNTPGPCSDQESASSASSQPPVVSETEPPADPTSSLPVEEPVVEEPVVEEPVIESPDVSAEGGSTSGGQSIDPNAGTSDDQSVVEESSLETVEPPVVSEAEPPVE